MRPAMLHPICLLAILALLTACDSVPNHPPTLDALTGGDAAKASGKWLMSLPMGLARLDSPPRSGKTAIVAVHGYKSEGYEWVHLLKTLPPNDAPTFFYRWDWTQCPDPAASQLLATLETLNAQHKDLERIQLFAHSYGGVIAAVLTQRYTGKIPLELNLVASPLAGHPRLEKICAFPGVEPPPKGAPISISQWRTVHKLDGAFKNMDFDPQVIELTGSAVTRLPETYKGHRLSHNWSLSWVADQLAQSPKAGETP